MSYFSKSFVCDFLIVFFLKCYMNYIHICMSLYFQFYATLFRVCLLLNRFKQFSVFDEVFHIYICIYKYIYTRKYFIHMESIIKLLEQLATTIRFFEVFKVISPAQYLLFVQLIQFLLVSTLIHTLAMQLFQQNIIIILQFQINMCLYLS